MNGNVVLNEGMLTGESIPISKTEISSTNDKFDF